MMHRGYDSRIIEEQRGLACEGLERLLKRSDAETARLHDLIREQQHLQRELNARVWILCDPEHRNHAEEIRRSYAEAMGHDYAPLVEDNKS